MINTPTRGIGKNTMETLERLALETGLSLWGAIGETIERKLLPPRALAALKSFQASLIEDARAMCGDIRRAPGGDAAAEDADAHRRDAEAPREATTNRFHSTRSNLARTSASISARTTSRTDGSRRAGRTLKPPSQKLQTRAVEGFRTPGDAATTAELLKFLIDRTGYIKQLEEEDTPEALSRIENLRELVNAAMDSRDRGETLTEFLDHAALVSDADTYDERAQITLMTLHAAKGLEFPPGLPRRHGRRSVPALAHAS